MHFHEVKFQILLDLPKKNRYIGGSNDDSAVFFFTYVKGKKIRDIGYAKDIFSHCYYTKTKNAEYAEDILLEARDSFWNIHARSSCYPEPGHVYILTRNQI